MARVALSVGGFTGNLQDYAPFEYTYTPDSVDVSTYHPASITFDQFFALYAKLRAIRVYGDTSESGGPFDFDLPAYQLTNTIDPSLDVAGPADESEIAEKCNQAWTLFTNPTNQDISLKLNDCGFDSGTGKFSPMLIVQGLGGPGVYSYLNESIPGLMEFSPCTLTFFGESITTYQYIAYPITGSITIDVPVSNGYWTYDGIWDADTGTQLITPIPTGF